MLRLHIVPATGEPFERLFDEESLIVGRSTSSDLALADPFLSRHHARLYRQGNKCLLEDLGSRNGTLLNGQRITEATPIEPGDVIRISGSLISIADSSSGDDPPPQLPEDPGLGATIFRPATELLKKAETATRPSQVEGEENLRRAAERLDLLNQIHEALGRSLSLAELLELILDRAFDHLQPEQGAIFLKGPEGGFYRAAQRSLSGIEDDRPLFRSLVSEVAEKGMAALVLNLETDERFSAAESMILSGVRSLVAAPLQDAEGVLGMIVLNSTAAARRFAEEDLELLVSMAAVAALKIRNAALTEEAAQRRRLEEELAMARRIQVGLLPDELPRVEGYELYGHNLPSRGVSGDYYQIQTRADGRECVLLIVDVSGKGMAASLLTFSLEALAAAPIEDGLGPAEICKGLSRRLYHRTQPERYATAFLAILEPESGTVRYTNAGHNPAAILRHSGEVDELPSCSMPIGLVLEATFTSRETMLYPGDTLLIYTDGITEAESPQGEQYGLDRLLAECQASSEASLEELTEAIDRALHEFTGGMAFSDDRTLVLARRLATDPQD